jgi:Tol biopolymer transport system component
VQLSDGSPWALLPRWSPDGTQIAFSAWSVPTGNGNQEIYMVSSEGGSAPKLLLEGKEGPVFPYWSPDGKKIVFNSGETVEDVRILDLNSQRVTTIPGSAGMNGPRWSPDGRYLVAGDGTHLMIFDFSTQQWSEIVQKGSVDSPEWSQDGQSIYFRRARGDKGLFRISIKGGTAEKIVDLKGWHDAGWWGAWMGLDPTDAPLLLRDIGSDDIYALTLDQK